MLTFDDLAQAFWCATCRKHAPMVGLTSQLAVCPRCGDVAMRHNPRAAAEWADHEADVFLVREQLRRAQLQLPWN